MMRDTKLKVEGPCRGCLSSDRKLASVRQLSCDLYYSLLTEEQKIEAVSLPHIALCWECIALLRKTQRFREQVQKAHNILQESSQLLPVEHTLSSLTFHRKLKYDAVFEENKANEIPLFHETQKATTGNDKVIIPTKYNSTATKSHEDNDKTIIPTKYNSTATKSNEDNDKTIIPTKYNSTATKSNVDNDKTIIPRKYNSTATKSNEDNDKTIIPTKYNSTATKSNVDNDKTIIPRKCNSTATKSNVDNVKNIKDVINDLLSKVKIKKEDKVEQPSNDRYDSEDNIIFEEDDSNFSSPEEISDVENNSKILEKVIQPKKNNKPLTEKVSKQIEKEHSSDDCEDNDNEDKPKRKRQKSELDPDFNLEDSENYASDDSENFKLIRIKMAKEQSSADPNLTVEGVDTKKTIKRQRTFRKIITLYNDIAELAPYFTEIEMSEQDIKITLQKDDAIVDKKKPIKCNICGLMFRQIQTLTTYHAVRAHKAQYPNQMQKRGWVNPPPVFPQKSVWQCNVCARMLRREHIVTHMNEYHRTQYFCIGDGCEWCERSFWNKKDLHQHWEEIHKQFMCDYCNKYKKTKTHLEKHIQDSHATRVKFVTNQCQLCMRVLSSIHALKVHHASIHEENNDPLEQRYCVECNLTFMRIKGYEKHFKEKHSGRPKPSGYPCETCGRVLANKVSLKNHVNIRHKGKTPYCCHICGKYLSKQEALKRHLDSHNNVKIPKTKPCTICGRMFVNNRVLRSHMYTHTGERPYKCSRCDAAFTQSHCLRVHLAKQHQVDASVRSDGTIIERSKAES